MRRLRQEDAIVAEGRRQERFRKEAADLPERPLQDYPRPRGVDEIVPYEARDIIDLIAEEQAEAEAKQPPRKRARIDYVEAMDEAEPMEAVGNGMYYMAPRSVARRLNAGMIRGRGMYELPAVAISAPNFGVATGRARYPSPVSVAGIYRGEAQIALRNHLQRIEDRAANISDGANAPSRMFDFSPMAADPRMVRRRIN
jgi:hypothetical protein